MPDHIENGINWTELYYQNNPRENRGFARWYRDRTSNQLAFIAFLIRILQVLSEGTLCGLSVWFLSLTRLQLPPIYIWAAIWPGIAFLGVTLYTLPTTFIYVNAKKSVWWPFGFEAISVFVWCITWGLYRQDEVSRSCNNQQECAIRIVYLVLGISEVVTFSLLAFFYSLSMTFVPVIRDINEREAERERPFQPSVVEPVNKTSADVTVKAPIRQESGNPIEHTSNEEIMASWFGDMRTSVSIDQGTAKQQKNTCSSRSIDGSGWPFDNQDIFK